MNVISGHMSRILMSLDTSSLPSTPISAFFGILFLLRGLILNLENMATNPNGLY